MIHATNMQGNGSCLLINPTHLLETGDTPKVFSDITQSWGSNIIIIMIHQ
jgi:hypothetical protein